MLGNSPVATQLVGSAVVLSSLETEREKEITEDEVRKGQRGQNIPKFNLSREPLPVEAVELWSAEKGIMSSLEEAATGSNRPQQVILS
jgi:hypothetical protein